MLVVKLLPDDTVEAMAHKIFHDFQVFQSCSITGFFEKHGEMLCKGEEVWKAVVELDFRHNWNPNRKRRKTRRIPGAMGGTIPHKAFKFQRVQIDNTIKYTIWRVQ